MLFTDLLGFIIFELIMITDEVPKTSSCDNQKIITVSYGFSSLFFMIFYCYHLTLISIIRFLLSHFDALLAMAWSVSLSHIRLHP